MTTAYTNDDGNVICVHNKSSRTIHPLALAELETVTGGTRRESVCGSQSVRGGAYTDTELIEVEPSKLEGEYLVRDGEVVAKLCGNCLKQITLP
jgi:hypothetical protein